MTPIEAALLGRIHVLWQGRAVDRRVYGAAWPQARWDRMTELRALVRVGRSGRRLARQTVERDAIDEYKAARDRGIGYHDLQAELR
jgi:hypothetical protein